MPCLLSPCFRQIRESGAEGESQPGLGCGCGRRALGGCPVGKPAGGRGAALHTHRYTHHTHTHTCAQAQFTQKRVCTDTGNARAHCSLQTQHTHKHVQAPGSCLHAHSTRTGLQTVCAHVCAQTHAHVPHGSHAPSWGQRVLPTRGAHSMCAWPHGLLSLFPPVQQAGAVRAVVPEGAHGRPWCCPAHSHRWKPAVAQGPQPQKRKWSRGQASTVDATRWPGARVRAATVKPSRSTAPPPPMPQCWCPPVTARPSHHLCPHPPPSVHGFSSCSSLHVASGG